MYNLGLGFVALMGNARGSRPRVADVAVRRRGRITVKGGLIVRRLWMVLIAGLAVLDVGGGAYLWWLLDHKAPRSVEHGDQVPGARTKH